MRNLVLATAAVAALAGAALLSTRADAMPANGGLAASVRADLIEPVHLVCRQRWTSYGWRRICYETGPGYGYYGGRPSFYFGGGGFHHHHHGHHGGHHGGHH